MRCRWLALAFLWGVASVPWTGTARADSLFESGRLLGTAGVSTFEGSGGGGLAPWAVIAGYGTRDAVGANVHGTYISLPNYSIQGYGTSAGFFDRFELSYQHIILDLGRTGEGFGLPRGYTIEEDVVGAKVRLLGDAIYSQDSWLPQVAAGVQVKFNGNPGLVKAIGARESTGADFYLAATKLLMRQGLVLDAGLRLTRANQFGLLGFGGDRSSAYHPEFEASAGQLLTRHLVVGAEFRTKPDNLSFAPESHAWDAFVAYFFTKNVSATLAYIDLGTVARRKNQDGVYASLELGF